MATLGPSGHHRSAMSHSIFSHQTTEVSIYTRVGYTAGWCHCNATHAHSPIQDHHSSNNYNPEFARIGCHCKARGHWFGSWWFHSLPLKLLRYTKIQTHFYTIYKWACSHHKNTKQLHYCYSFVAMLPASCVCGDWRGRR